MGQDSSIAIRFPAETYSRLVSGKLTDADERLISNQLIAAGAPLSDETPQYQISVGGVKDFIIGTKVVLDADEQTLLNAIHAAHQKIESDANDSSLRAYIAALRDYSRSAYRSLPLPGGRSLDDVFVPVTVKAIQSDEFLGDFAISDIFRNSTISRRGTQIILQGQPGSGKSTILRQIAKFVWTEPEKLGLGRRFLPMLIRLQSLALASGATLEQRLLTAIADARDFNLIKDPPQDFFTSWPSAAESPWLLLLDGLDEVPRDRQGEIKAWISDRQRSGVSIALSSRPTTALDSTFCKAFTSYNVEAFTHSQQSQLATNLLDGEAEGFLRCLADANADFLFSTPLLITLAATIFHRDGTLPFPRSKLYRRIIDLWQEEATERASEGELAPELRDLPRPTLEHIALAMTEDSESSSIEAIERSVARFMSISTGRSTAITLEPARRLVDFVLRRSGVLLAFGSRCDWLHRSFREYLAACRLAESQTAQSTIGTDLFQRWNQDSWKQILLFLLGSWSGQNVSDLLKPVAAEEVPYGLIFCGDALAEGATVDPVFEAYLIRKLCEVALSNATGTICVRLLAGITDDSIVKAEGVLRVIRKLSNRPMAQPHYARLIEHMLREARSWKKEMGNAAINDLAILERRPELLALARDPKVHVWVRHEAARELAKLGERDSATPIIASILHEPVSERIAINLVDALGECKEIEPLQEIVRDTRLPIATRLYSLDVLGKQGAVDFLEQISNDGSQPAPLRERAIVALSNAGRNASSQSSIQELLIQNESDPGSLRDTVERLGRAKNWAALADVVKSNAAPMSARNYSVNVLEREKNQDELIALLSSADLSVPLQLKICKAVITLGDLPSVARQLASFFDIFFQTVTEGAQLVEAHRLRAELYLSLRDHEHAVEEYGSILVAKSDDEWVLGLRGNSYRLLGKYAQALDDFNASLQFDPDDAWDLNRRGMTLYSLSRYVDASRDFDRALQLDPREKNFLDNYADSLLETGDLDKALEISDRSVNADFTGSVHYAYRADVQLARGNFAEAVLNLDQAITLNPSYRWAYYRRGFIHRIMGDLKAAESDLCQAIDLKPNYVSARAELACVFIHSGDMQGALRELREAETDDPSARRIAYLRWLATSMGREPTDEGEPPALSWKVREEDTFELRFDDALHSLNGGVRERCEQMVSNASSVQLRQVVIPELQLFLTVFPRDVCALELWKRASGRLEMNGNERHEGEGKMKLPWLFGRTGKAQLDKKMRHAVYCPLHSIAGLEHEKERALTLLKAHANNQRSIVMLSLEDNWVYGQCNFKMNPNDSYDLKFVDTIDTIVKRNLKIFADGNVRQLLFVDRDLRSKIEDGANAMNSSSDLFEGTPLHCLNFRLVKE